MNLASYQHAVARKGDYRSKCTWCWGVDTGSRFNCTCTEKCEKGICPADVDEFDPPAVPRFDV